jgi:hypothetical protein
MREGKGILGRILGRSIRGFREPYNSRTSAHYLRLVHHQMCLEKKGELNLVGKK